MRWAILACDAAIAGSTVGALRASPDLHADWLGQPSHDEAVPALSDMGPTHSSFALAGAAAVAVAVLISLDKMKRSGAKEPTCTPFFF